jgi:hypothetical protein
MVRVKVRVRVRVRVRLGGMVKHRGACAFSVVAEFINYVFEKEHKRDILFDHTFAGLNGVGMTFNRILECQFR